VSPGQWCSSPVESATVTVTPRSIPTAGPPFGWTNVWSSATRPREAKPAPAKLRQANLRPAAVEPADTKVAALGQPEALTATLALVPRTQCQPVEPTTVGGIEVTKRLLKALGDRFIREPLEPLASLELRQLRLLLHAPNAPPTHAPRSATLLKCRVPHHTAATRDPRRLTLLLER
jgi:hypothetical protein